jgi:hypothetical protein
VRVGELHLQFEGEADMFIARYWDDSGSWASSVGMMTRPRAGRSRNRGSSPGRSRRIFSSPKRRDRFGCGAFQPSV